MPRLRSVRTKEEAAKVPEDQAISVLISDDEPAAPKQEFADGQPEKKEEPKAEQREPEVREPAEDAGQDDLKKRLDDLQKAERVAQNLANERQQALEEAQRRAKQYEEEIAKARGEATASQMDSVLNALAAAQAESDAAQRDYEAALGNQDAKAQSDAQRRLSRAEARIVQYEDSKAVLEDRAKRVEEAAKKQPERGAQGDPFEAAIAPLPDGAKNWLRAHPEFMRDQRKNRKLASLDDDLLEEGHTRGSPEYIQELEVRLGMKQKPTKREDDDVDEPEPRKERVVTSAPVSRESPSLRDGRPTTTRITLTPEQREAARNSGISEIEYAKQLIRLQEAKKSGLIQ